MKVISLFSGAGGLDFGLFLAGNKIIWANDIDKDAVLTYRRNIMLMSLWAAFLVRDFLKLI